MLFIDLTHTSHCRAHTGIQQVCRSLYASLPPLMEICPLCYDPFERRWRPLDALEIAAMQPPRDYRPGSARGTRWTISQKCRGLLHRFRGAGPNSVLPEVQGLLAPEIFSADVQVAYRQLFPLVRGPRVALFYDAVTLRLPQYATAGAVERFPAYLAYLAGFDGIAAISEASRSELIEHWDSLGLEKRPPVAVIRPGAFQVRGADRPPSGGIPMILSVGTLEGRKNHMALLQAAESLWLKGVQFRLLLAGSEGPDKGRPALDYLRNLRRSGRPVEWTGPVSEERLHALYEECHFTVYPSLSEGFGLPVLESLGIGRPCICGSGGALSEVATGGGCVQLEDVGSSTLAEAMDKLLGDASAYDRLAQEIRNREFKTPDQFGEELLDWMNSLSRMSQIKTPSCIR